MASSEGAGAPRVLYVRTEGRSTLSRADQLERERAGEASRRALVEDSFGFDLLGESDIRQLDGIRGTLLRRLPVFLALGLEVAHRRNDYDVVVSWAEKYSVGIAAGLFWRRTRPLHLAIMDWVSKPAVRIPLIIVRSGIDRVLTWSSVQGIAAIERIGFRPEQIVFVRHPVDDAYFAPIDAPRTTLFSAGETQRDFPTLIEAVKDLDISTTIAASRVGVYSGFRTRLSDARDQFELPANISIEAMEPQRLRQAYAEAKVVIIPLVPTENNAGISVLLEAMAMGRPVVITRTEGQVDVVEHGITGLYVPPNDPMAMRNAIISLLQDPVEAEAMGRRAREYVLAHNRVDDFAETIRTAAREAAFDAAPRRRRRERSMSTARQPRGPSHQAGR